MDFMIGCPGFRRFIEDHLVSLDFPEFNWVLPSLYRFFFTGFRCLLAGFTGFYLVSVRLEFFFTSFDWLYRSFTGFFIRFYGLD